MALTQVKTSGIADDAVTTDKLANAINTERTANTAKSTNATHTGEVTGSGALTITADAVTGAKIADDAIDSEHYTDGSIDTAHIADDQITLAKMAGLARGKLIYGDASGDPAALTVGSANQVLTSDGTDVAWAAAAAGGLTEADMWRIHSETVGGNSPQTTNWERADTGGFGHLGTGLSESSGVFTFPSTGYWYIQLTVMARSGSDSSAIYGRIDYTSNNGGYWATYAVGSGNINYVSGTWWYGGATCQHMFDITDTSNQKVRFHLHGNDSVYIEANSGQQVSGFVALRLADT